MIDLHLTHASMLEDIGQEQETLRGGARSARGDRPFVHGRAGSTGDQVAQRRRSSRLAA
jgi:hypothetical protein